MPKKDFLEIAKTYAFDMGQESLLPVIEKEMLHYHILGALDKTGLLRLVAFQGGTCLRLCYGGVRYSEDLDFACGDNFAKIEPEEVEAILKTEIEKRFNVGVRLTPPKRKTFESGAEMKRWWVVVNTAPERPDLPSQRIKLEFANIPSYTKSPRQVKANYSDYMGGYETLVVGAQSPSEILADKLVALPNTDAAEYIRYRDLWDINWIAFAGKANIEEAVALSERKHRDYCCEKPFKELMIEGANRAGLVRSDEFKKQMSRFVPATLLEQVFGGDDQLTAMEETIRSVFETAARKTLTRLADAKTRRTYPSPKEVTASAENDLSGQLEFKYTFEDGSYLCVTLEQDGIWCFSSRFDGVEETNYSRTFEEGYLMNYRLVSARRELNALEPLPISTDGDVITMKGTDDVSEIKKRLAAMFDIAEEQIDDAISSIGLKVKKPNGPRGVGTTAEGGSRRNPTR